MKSIPDINEVIESMFKQSCDSYNCNETLGDVRINFDLYHEEKKMPFSLFSNNGKLEMDDKLKENPGLSIKCDALDWIRISGKTLNPVLAVMRGRLRMVGDKSLIGKVFGISGKTGRSWKQIKDNPADYEYKAKRKWKTPGKIAVFLASPTGKEGYTHLALNMLLEGMKDSGSSSYQGSCRIDTVILSEYEINHCKGCMKCWFITDGKCVIKDDYEKINQIEMEADLVVYALPLYVDGVPGIFKNFLDRNVKNAYPYFVQGINHIRHPRRNVKERYAVVLSIAGLPEMVNFKALINHFDQMADNRHLPVLEYILIPQMVALLNNPLNYPLLLEKKEALKNAGRQIVETGKVDGKTLKIINKTISKNKIVSWIEEGNDHIEKLINEKAVL